MYVNPPVFENQAVKESHRKSVFVNWHMMREN